ncbi:MAG: hypothetical protein EPO24_10625 [Bacteroidetes bacterium]|nr:MAG: hypothetical protein EPO24_10625 [Bacteroidota bacterium]
MKRFMLLFSCIFAMLLFVFVGCKEDEESLPLDISVPSTLFPLTAGHVITYSGYLTAGESETKIAGTETGYSTTWTVNTLIPVTAVFPAGIFPNLVGETAVLVRDTTNVPAVSVTNKFTPVFIRQDSTSGDFSYLTNLGYFYRSASTKIWKSTTDTTARADSLRFVVLAKPSAGIGTKFTCFNEDFTSYAGGVSNPVTLNLKIEGVFEAKETITVGSTDYETYRLVISRTVSAGGVALSQGVTAKLWLANNVGPIQMFLAGNAEAPGNFRTMTSKSF